MPPRVLATMVTTTSYGTWLPGDARGYVEEGRILPPDPKRWEEARALAHDPVYFTLSQQDCLFEALCRAAIEFGYRLTDVSIESWHVHWIIEHGFDSVKTMVGRLKTRMRQAVNIGRHPGCRMTNGQTRPRNNPGGAGGYGTKR